MSRWERVTTKTGKEEPGLFRLISTGDIYVRRKVKGKVVEKNTGETTLGLARAKATLIVAEEVQKRANLRTAKSATFGEVAHWVLSKHSKKVRVGTQVNYQKLLPRLIDAFGKYDVNEITEDLFLEWLDEHREEVKDRRKTFSDYSKHMNLVMRFAYKKKLATHLVTFKNPDEKKENVGRVYTLDEIDRLKSAMNGSLLDQFILSYECMMRLREVLYLTWERVDLDRRFITLRAADVKTGSKTGRGRIVALTDNAYRVLKARFEKRDSAFVFPARGNLARPQHDNKTGWKWAKARAKVTGRARWHDLRHTAITLTLKQAGVNILHVSQYAGVSVAVIQKVYLHTDDEVLRGVANAVSNRHGVKLV